MNYYIILLLLLIVNNKINAEITGPQYASIPELFYHDNYDICMLRGDEAFYCYVKFVLEPANPKNMSEIWNYIKNVSSIETNYRHDHLRHSICVPKTCVGVNKSDEEDPLLKKALENCYNEKLKEFGLKGSLSEIRCDTGKPKYPVDWLDVISAIFFITYILFVLYATYYDQVISCKSSKEYKISTSSLMGKILLAFSLIRNWDRLTKIKNNSSTEKFQSIQGIRFYNSSLVLMSHTFLIMLATPVANTRFAETVHEHPLSIFFASGHLCMTTFFFITSFFFAKDIFEYLKDKTNLSLKTALWIFTARLWRFLPSLAFVILFHATWLRHMNTGPHWEKFAIPEYKYCRKNWWTNLLFINTLISSDNMCLQTSWWLAVSIQHVIFSLVFIWILKKYENYFWLIIGTVMSSVTFYGFLQNYYYDLPSLLLYNTEMYYDIENVFNNIQIKYQLRGFTVNLAGTISGIAFGYYFSKYLSNSSKEKLLNTKLRMFLWWVFILGIGIGSVVVPGLVIFLYSNKQNAFWASVYNTLSRSLFAIFIGVLITGFSEGAGNHTVRICSLPPTSILGRLTFSIYLTQVCVIICRHASIRFPVYISEFTLFFEFFGDLAVVCIVATLFTLFVEMPVSALQNHIFIPVQVKAEGNENTPKNK